MSRETKVPITVEPARYANGMLAVRTLDDTAGFKGRAARLIGHLKGRYSGRERAYIMSPAKVVKLIQLLAAGRDASSITGELYPAEG